MKILVRTPNWLGDIVMSKLFFDNLKEKYPNSQIDVITKKGFKKLIEKFAGINSIYEYEKNGIIGLYKFSKKFREKKYDIYITLPNSLSTAMMGYFAKAKKRIGYKSECRGIFLTDKIKESKKKLHRAEVYRNLIDQEEYEGKREYKLDNINKLETKGRNIEEKKEYRIILNINSEAESRRYPLEKWKNVIEKLNGKVKCKIFLIGVKKESSFIDELIKIVNKKDNLINMAGKTDIDELIKLMVKSDLVISNDSGPAHLANISGVKLIVIFGAGDNKVTGPYNKSNSIVIRAKNIECAPCVSNTCKYEVTKCLEEIDEELIVKKAMEFLK